MRINPRGRSENLEDRRGASSGGGGGGGFGGGGGLGGGGRGFGGGKLGLGGIVILLILSAVFKQDFLGLAGGGATAVQPAPSAEAAPINDPQEEPLVLMVSAVLDSTQSMWSRVLPELGAEYRDAKLVLFRDATETACGYGQSATGPFYCPGDEKVYIDLAFFQELRDRFKAPGDFAQAYVLAHEIGHHVQNILGTSGKVHRAQQRASESEGNALSVRLELQADCYAGVWAATAARQGILEAGDVEEGLGAASAVGDDRLQKMATGRVSPESWTHGSSAQRMEWFRRGFDGGDARRCDTFSR
ncbi:MAG: zinc metallopeptidase [Gemmatimonadetes bacterium]|jgi:predicted metalloprotease|nr:zinc metallopeptidase [Gemmatimonadota bacterium]MBK6841635.1 zinc metallopeptidase [Gemmatimonadota bacterium]MBK7835339.1 zinc metallopeptidase [Gemmatimonadota bacterium]MBK9406683.1 zinc metallopeptidase [Gemmatimonadota bacterium]MBP9107894.1 zinc metallopeptidase [Gemmatimonadaceae bacterium]